MVRKIDIAQSDSANLCLRYLDERRIDAARLCEFVYLGKDGALLLRPEIVVIDRYVHTARSPALAIQNFEVGSGASTIAHVGEEMDCRKSAPHLPGGPGRHETFDSRSAHRRPLRRRVQSFCIMTSEMP